MHCHHCPGQVFESEEELQVHRAKHVAIQQSLRRRGRAYGARVEDGNTDTILPPDSTSQPPILPLFNIPTTQASGSSEAQTSTTPRTPGNLPSNARRAGSVKNGNSDMQFHYSLAELMRHDDSYLFFRQFSLLNIQNLLWMQSELAQLEKLLTDMRGAEPVNNIVAKEEAAELKSLIREKLQLYNDALLRYSQVSKLGRPDETSILDVRRWIADTSIVTAHGLATTLSSDNGDHAALAQRQSQGTWAWKMTERILWRLLAKRAPGGKVIPLPSGGKLHVWDDSMIRLAMRGVLTFILSLTLLIPLLALTYVVDQRLITAVTASGSILLAIILATLTQCRDYEIIVAVSAYAAVLMVYTQA